MVNLSLLYVHERKIIHVELMLPLRLGGLETSGVAHRSCLYHLPGEDDWIIRLIT